MQKLLLPQRRDDGGHRHVGPLFEQFDHAVDCVGVGLRLVSLDVTKMSTSLIRRATSAIRSVPLGALGAGHHHLAPKRPHRRGNLLMIGRHAHAPRPPRLLGRLISMLHQRLAGFGQQHLASQPRRAETGGDDDLADGALSLRCLHPWFPP